MALISPTSTFANYQQILGMGSMKGASESQAAATAGPSFDDVMKKTFAQTADSLRQHDKLSMEHAIGKEDPTKIITSAAEIDVTVNTAVALRDKFVALIDTLQKMQI
jgi:flagellar hook-basal body complex protein FliE